MLPKVLLDIIRDYVISMMLFDAKKTIEQGIRKKYVIAHLKAVQQSTLNKFGLFSYKYCLEVLNYMNKNNMRI